MIGTEHGPGRASPTARPPAQAGSGLSEAEVAARAASRPRASRRAGGSRSYASIVRANVLTVFNLILAAFGGLTLAFGDARDALFLGIIVANSGIGITQEVRAKRALERLSLLVAPHARVRRSGREQRIASDGVVVDDVVLLEPGEQLVADGTLLEARELRLDESILSGESEPVHRGAGEEVRSGAFVVEGSASYRVAAVGGDSFAARITGQARSFRHPRSPLERAVNRLLYGLVALVIALGAVLGYALYHRHASTRTAVATSSAGVVTLVPEGLMVLVSLTYAAGAIRMSRRGVLAQQLNAIESLASVDTICIDKTGTLTEPSLRVVETIAAPGCEEHELAAALAALAASSTHRNATLEAIAAAFPAPAQAPLAEIPFSSRRRWSAVQADGGAVYLGAPEVLAPAAASERTRTLQRSGRRVLALAASNEPLPGDPDGGPPAGLRALGHVVIAEELRPNVRDTVAYLRREHVEIKVLSGDAPETAAAIARDVGIPVDAVAHGDDIPTEPGRLRDFALAVNVVGRVSPEGKEAIVRSLTSAGRYVAMVGDGVNDVPALKSSRLAIAQGSGTQMARTVADLVLVGGDFGAVPALVAEGRRALRNLQRVSRLYVTKSALAAFLILTIGTSSEAYPLLPRHLTLAASLTIGIPSFFLALAPSSGAWSTRHFVADVARFAVPAGVIVGAGLIAGYLFALHDLDVSVADARTVALTTLVLDGLYLVAALEAGGSRTRSALVGVMCATMAGCYAAALALPWTRSFFQLNVPDLGMLLTALLASAVSVGALDLCGFSLRAPAAQAGTP